MMRLMHILMFAGIFSLYIGFSAFLGYLIRTTRGPSYRCAGWLIISAYAIIIWLPTSAFIALLGWLAVILRALMILAGVTTTILVAAKPKWIPALVWSRTFNRRYLSITMVIVALAALIPWMPDPNIGSLTLGIAACAAGLTALHDIPAQV